MPRQGSCRHTLIHDSGSYRSSPRTPLLVNFRWIISDFKSALENVASLPVYGSPTRKNTTLPISPPRVAWKSVNNTEDFVCEYKTMITYTSVWKNVDFIAILMLSLYRTTGCSYYYADIALPMILLLNHHHAAPFHKTYNWWSSFTSFGLFYA